MSAPAIILASGQILATQSTGFLGIEVQTPGYLFGIVEKVYDGSDKTTTGTLFMFKQSEALVFKYGSTIYYQLEENVILNSYIPPP